VRFNKEFKIGLFSVIAISLLYLGFNFLKGIDFFSTSTKYYVVYNNIGGLQVSNSVIINGLSIGRVSDITLIQNERNRIIVELDIQGKIILDDSTSAVLISEGFLGGKAIELKIPENITSPLEEGDTLISEIAIGLLESLTNQTQPVADNIGALIQSITNVLESFDTTELLLRQTIIKINENLDQTSLLMKENRKSIQESLSSISGLSKNLDEASSELKPLLSGINVFVDSLNNLQLANSLKIMSATLDNLNQLLSNLNEGQGTMGRMLHDDSLYVYLTKTAEDLDKLFVDLRENPGRYVQVSVFGKKDKSSKKKKNEK
jgi:phospholipid/cholesterol/gamma-HCH transport system substrate-binding protein